MYNSYRPLPVYPGPATACPCQSNPGRTESKMEIEIMDLGMPSFQKSAVFLNIVQKAFDPPPFYLNICPILRGVFFKRIFEH